MSDKGKILAVDDTPASLKLLSDLLRNEGYDVRSAINGALALRSAAMSPPELVLLDIRMPEMDGFEVCRRLKADPNTASVPVIFVSALTDTDEKLHGFELGAVDFVTKPFQREELLARVRVHLEVDRLRNHLEEAVQERTHKLQESQKQQRKMLVDFVAMLGSTVELRDPYTAGHQRRVADLAEAIARELQWPPEQIEGLYLASVVHDFGKIRVPTEILCKPGKLKELEFRLVQEHSKTGYDILRSIVFPWPIAQTVYQHHERLNGSGYPQGLHGPDILPEAKVLAVADVVEAMMSHRPYRPSLGPEMALQEIEAHRGVLYEPAVVDACVRLFREQGYRLPG
ncbi:HD domain-containing phosphohydrolase [Giesbergeria anulus]|uniref:Putative two-component system response regulator n=1 Tax=Giesbergeria anulus TaxID=180197 RepID=A0A1H9PPK0_9BURK|nr:HD domain-containing phosphohydrolase [Giesbergeria anulus]SER50132.1 putative two-component system response regulator [Giesbergeria anulus]